MLTDSTVRQNDPFQLSVAGLPHVAWRLKLSAMCLAHCSIAGCESFSLGEFRKLPWYFRECEEIAFEAQYCCSARTREILQAMQIPLR